VVNGEAEDWLYLATQSTFLVAVPCKLIRGLSEFVARVCPVLEPLEGAGREMVRAELLQGHDRCVSRDSRSGVSGASVRGKKRRRYSRVSGRIFWRWRDRLREAGPEACAVGASASRRAHGRPRRSCARRRYCRRWSHL
jgi:hypothetical protein